MTNTQPDTPPKLAEIVNTMSPAEATLVLNNVRDPTISAEWISNTLAIHGYEISASTLRTYRRRLRQEV